jgi:hypothetical protein
MKRNPALASVLQRLAPGRLSRSGFLGQDERSLEEIVAADLADLDAAGVGVAQIADLLDELHQRADEGMEAPQDACGGRATVEIIEAMGRIPCPFACGFRTHKAVVHARAGTVDILFTPLHAHLIREHGFFQGRGSDFRLEPRDLVALYVACKS